MISHAPRICGQWIILAGLAVGLVACSSSEEIRLQGERISLETSTLMPQISAETAALPMTLPQPAKNTAWSQYGSMADHVIWHLDFRKDTALSSSYSVPLEGDWDADDDAYFITPIIAAGRVFALSPDGVLQARRLDNGAALWQLRVLPEDSEDRLTPLAGASLATDGDSRIFVNTGNGHLAAFSLVDGKRFWHKALEDMGFGGISTYGDTLLRITQRGDVVAHDTSNGNVRWRYRYPAGDYILPRIQETLPASPAISGKMVAAITPDDRLLALDANSGRLLWQDVVAERGMTDGNDPLAAHHSGSPVLDRGLVLVSAKGGISAWRPHLGLRLWRQALSGKNLPPAIGDATLFGVNTDTKTVYAAVRATGALRWITNLSSQEDSKTQQDSTPLPLQLSSNTILFGPYLLGGRVLVLTADRETDAAYAVWISPQTGKILSQTQLDTIPKTPPIIADKRLVTIDHDGRMQVYQ